MKMGVTVVNYYLCSISHRLQQHDQASFYMLSLEEAPNLFGISRISCLPKTPMFTWVFYAVDSLMY